MIDRSFRRSSDVCAVWTSRDRIECMSLPPIFFFFSSRRRLTRLQGDWSSDVCSSDLKNEAGGDVLNRMDIVKESGNRVKRSEERRVGKECRSRRSPYHQKKKIEKV